MCSGTKYINVQRVLVGFGETRDFAFNALLEKLEAFEFEIECVEACRSWLNPPDNVKFRVYRQNNSGKIRWKCFWGPGVLEFECAPIGEFEDLRH
jgi:hypothetical protein